MTVDPNGVNVCETEEFEAHLNTLPDGGVGVRAAIAAEKAGTLPKARIVANSKNENGRGVIELASADESAEWAAFSQSISHPEAKFECDGAKVILRVAADSNRSIHKDNSAPDAMPRAFSCFFISPV